MDKSALKDMSDSQIDKLLEIKKKYGKSPFDMSDEELDRALSEKKGVTDSLLGSVGSSKVERIPKSAFEVSPKGLLKGSLQALPIAGGVAGGIVGGPVGAGLLAAGGYGLQKVGEKALLDEDLPERKEYYGGLLKTGLSASGGEMTGPILTKGLTKAAPYVQKGLTKAGSMLSGVPEKEIATYAQKGDKVSKLYKEYGGNIPAAADDIRDNLKKEIISNRSKISAEIGDVLEKTPKDKTSNVKGILDSLSKYKNRIDPDLEPEKIAEINELYDKVQKYVRNNETAGKPFELNAAQIHKIKKVLDEYAKQAYMKGGQIFSRGEDTAKAAKEAASSARKMVNELEPAVKKANEKLSRLHDIEETMNKNILTPGKPEASFLAAGSGTNLRARNYLQELGEAANVPALEKAEELAAAKTFGSPGLSSIDVTGKGVERMARGGVVGGAAGMAIGGLPGAAVGAGVGSMITSPLALKMMINTGKIPITVIRKLGGSEKALKFFQTPAGNIMLQKNIQPGPYADSYQMGEGNG